MQFDLKKLPQLTLLCTSLFLASCNEEEKKCSDKFISDYKNLESQFSKVYSPSTSSEDFSSFRKQIESFTSDHPEKCETDGIEYNPNKELEAFLALTKVSTEMNAKVIYGNDDRIDVTDSNNSNHKKWAKSVAVQIDTNDIGPNGELPTTSIGEGMGLCKSERFFDQINPGRCSGFLVGKDILVTAGHCMKSQTDCDNFSWAFDFNKGVTSLSSENVYKCAAIISQDFDSQTDADYAVIKLDRKVENRSYLRFRTEGKISNNAPIVVIGHPSGLPMKVAAGANVRTNSDDWFFVGNLDTFGGNSGSPVINDSTGLVEGILVRGETDYNWQDDGTGRFCKVSNQCKDNDCRGEDVTRITKVESLPEQINSNDLFAELFEDSSNISSNAGIVFPVSYREDGDKYISGIKFLSNCALHFASVDSPREWINSKITNCSSNKLQLTGIIDEYVDSL